MERRKYKRFKVRSGAFAVAKSHSTQVGQVIDISEGGMSYLYMDDHNRAEDSFKMGIFVSGKGYYFDDIGASVVSDYVVPKESPFSFLTMRRQCIKFDAMDENQEAGIRSFISTFANNGS